MTEEIEYYCTNEGQFLGAFTADNPQKPIHQIRTPTAPPQANYRWIDDAWVVPNSAGDTLTYVAGQNITIGQAIILNSGQVFRADHTNLTHVGFVLGIAENSALTGFTVDVRVSGEVVNSGWTFFPNQHIFVGVDGALLTSVPATGFVQKLGVSVSSDTVFVETRKPVKRS